MAHLHSSPAPHQPPQLSVCGRRLFPRIALRSGAQIGVALQPAAGTPAAGALEQASSLVRSTGRMVSVSVPGPAVALPALVAAALAHGGTDPEQLELSFSMRSLDGDRVESLLALSALRDLGVSVALRGYGGGRPAPLPRMPFSAVILAPGCLHHVPGNAAATNFIQTLIDMAHSLKLATIAIGIETEAQRAILSGFGCQAGEGSLFGPPGAA